MTPNSSSNSPKAVSTHYAKVDRWLRVKKRELYALRIKQVVDWKKHRLHILDSFSPESFPLQELGRERTAIALIAANRPDYFEQVALSLSKTREAYSLPIFLFLDRTEDSVMDAQVRMLQQFQFPNVHVIRRPVNFGCGRNIIDARRQLFDIMGFDRVFVLEDDMLISPQYLSLCTHLMDWAESHFTNIGVVQGWNICTEPLEEKLKFLDRVEGSFQNLWGYLMTRKCWNTIRKTLYRYEDVFLRTTYQDRPRRLIREWGEIQAEANRPSSNGKSGFPVDSGWENRRGGFFKNFPSGQDGITALALDQNGWIQLATRVNRGAYIGERGIHMSPKRFRNEKSYHLIRLDEFKSDQSMRGFTPCL